MPKPCRVLSTATALGLALAMFTACSPGTTTSTPAGSSSSSSVSTKEQVDAALLCDAAAAYAGSVAKFRGILTPEAPIEQLRSARDEVVSAYVQLQTAARNMADYRIVSVEAAQKKFSDAVDDVRDQATVPEAVESLKNEASDVQTAVSDLTKEVKC